MWPDRVSNPGPLTYESGALLTALRSPAPDCEPAELVQGTLILFMTNNLPFQEFLTNLLADFFSNCRETT